MKKKGFFFTIDAIIALGVLLVGFLLILSTYYFKPIESQVVFFSEDILDLFASTKVAELNDPAIFQMWCASCDNAMHVIDNPENTLLEQIGEFFYISKNDCNNAACKINNLLYANQTVRYVITGLINPQYSYEVSIKDEKEDRKVLFREDKSGKQIEDLSNLLIVSKRIVYGIHKNSVVWGPYIAEVRIWQ